MHWLFQGVSVLPTQAKISILFPSQDTALSRTIPQKKVMQYFCLISTLWSWWGWIQCRGFRAGYLIYWKIMPWARIVWCKCSAACILFLEQGAKGIVHLFFASWTSISESLVTTWDHFFNAVCFNIKLSRGCKRCCERRGGNNWLCPVILLLKLSWFWASRGKTWHKLFPQGPQNPPQVGEGGGWRRETKCPKDISPLFLHSQNLPITIGTCERHSVTGIYGSLKFLQSF